MPVQGGQFPSLVHVPNPNGLIGARRDEPEAVGCESQSGNPGSVANQLAELSPGRRREQFDVSLRVVVARTGGERLAVGRERERRNLMLKGCQAALFPP